MTISDLPKWPPSTSWKMLITVDFWTFHFVCRFFESFSFKRKDILRGKEVFFFYSYHPAFKWNAKIFLIFSNRGKNFSKISFRLFLFLGILKFFFCWIWCKWSFIWILIVRVIFPNRFSWACSWKLSSGCLGQTSPHHGWWRHRLASYF